MGKIGEALRAQAESKEKFRQLVSKLYLLFAEVCQEEKLDEYGVRTVLDPDKNTLLIDTEDASLFLTPRPERSAVGYTYSIPATAKVQQNPFFPELGGFRNEGGVWYCKRRSERVGVYNEEPLEKEDVKNFLYWVLTGEVPDPFSPKS